MKVINGMIELPEAIQKILEETKDKSIHFTRDAPKLTPKQLAKFKPRSAERLARYGLPPNPEVQETPKNVLDK